MESNRGAMAEVSECKAVDEINMASWLTRSMLNKRSETWTMPGLVRTIGPWPTMAMTGLQPMKVTTRRAIPTMEVEDNRASICNCKADAGVREGSSAMAKTKVDGATDYGPRAWQVHGQGW